MCLVKAGVLVQILKKNFLKLNHASDEHNSDTDCSMYIRLSPDQLLCFQEMP